MVSGRIILKIPFLEEIYSVRLDDDVLHGHLTSDATVNISILRAKSSGERVLPISIILNYRDLYELSTFAISCYIYNIMLQILVWFFDFHSVFWRHGTFCAIGEHKDMIVKWEIRMTGAGTIKNEKLERSGVIRILC